MTADEQITALLELDAPYGKKIVVQDVTYESGLRMLRLRFREGKRFTVIDLDGDTAGRLARTMNDWSDGLRS